MGPRGAIACVKSSSRPFSQSWSWITTLGAGSCAQLRSAAARGTMRLNLDMTLPPPWQAKKSSELQSTELQIGQRRTGNRIEQGPAPLGTVDGPGDFEHGADAPLPR